MIEYRPWGLLPSLLPELGHLNWSLIGALSTEDRCLATWRDLKQGNKLAHCIMLRIDDEASPYRNEVVARTTQITEQYLAEGGRGDGIRDFGLFARLEDVFGVCREFIDNGGDNLILDISSLPKRFFFAFIRVLRERSTAQNIIVTCAMPQSYATDGKPLAENPEPWRHLPGFLAADPEPDNPLVVIGIGYESLGLTTIFESGAFRNSQVKMLFPFPAQPSGLRKNWEFVRELSAYVPNIQNEVERIDARDVSETYQFINRLTGSGKRYSVMAPFGPKTLSLAMCLYATSPKVKGNSAVFYTQPKAYHPGYSSGVAMVNGVPEIYGYCVRLNHTDLYQ